LSEKNGLDRLWRRYRQLGDERARERLIVVHAPLVKYVVDRLLAALPPHLERADLMSYGMDGLLSAMGRFDFAGPGKFESYAVSRIKGAVIDELRTLDWVPRSVRERTRQMEQAALDLERQLGRPATERELAAKLGLKIRELRLSLADVSRSSLVALDEAWSAPDGQGESVALLDTVEDPRGIDPARGLDMSELGQQIADTLEQLPEREKLVVGLYYYENLTLREIGVVLGIGESRVSQLHAKAVITMRADLQVAAAAH
jgi:RNA polymerase sigma factor for flagellar operon FliA